MRIVRPPESAPSNPYSSDAHHVVSSHVILVCGRIVVNDVFRSEITLRQLEVRAILVSPGLAGLGNTSIDSHLSALTEAPHVAGR